MPTNQIECAEGIQAETLSALRDELLSNAEARHLREHIATCPACQARVSAHDEVARALLRQRELEPGDHILRGVRRRAEEGSSMSHLARRRVFGGLGALASVAAVLLLFVYVFGQHGGGGAGPHAGTPATTASATLTATAAASDNAFKVNDQQVANQLSVAYVQNNDVWLGMNGARPTQVTSFGLSPQRSFDWRLVWTDDGSKLLVVASENPPAQTDLPYVWIILTATGSAGDLPTAGSVDLRQGCMQACYWLGDRYVVHANPNAAATHYIKYEVYDTQGRRELSTALDNVEATQLEVRGSEVYFSSYYVSPNPIPGTIDRFDLATNTITANVFTAPGQLVTQGIDAGAWDLSADGSRVVYEFGFGLTTHCPATTCYTYYQDSTGTYALFPGYQSQAADGTKPLSDLTISPDGRTAAVLFGTNTGTPAGVAPEDILQQGTPGGAVSEEGVSSGNSQGWIAGWTTHTPGAILEQSRLDANGNTLSTSFYFAPAGASGEATLVESLALPATVAVWVSPS